MRSDSIGKKTTKSKGKTNKKKKKENQECKEFFIQTTEWKIENVSKSQDHNKTQVQILKEK